LKKYQQVPRTLSRSLIVNPSLLTLPIRSTSTALVARMRPRAVCGGKVFSSRVKNLCVWKGGREYGGTCDDGVRCGTIGTFEDAAETISSSSFVSGLVRAPVDWDKSTPTERRCGSAERGGWGSLLVGEV
jgi:hypothetical protein